MNNHFIKILCVLCNLPSGHNAEHSLHTNGSWERITRCALQLKTVHKMLHMQSRFPFLLEPGCISTPSFPSKQQNTTLPEHLREVYKMRPVCSCAEPGDAKWQSMQPKTLFICPSVLHLQDPHKFPLMDFMVLPEPKIHTTAAVNNKYTESMLNHFWI